MKRTFIFITLFASVIYCHSIAQALDNDLIKSYQDLFSILSDKVKIDTQEIKQFNELINYYIARGKEDFGESAVYYSSDIAIVNGSLIVGHAFQANKVSSSNIQFIKQNFNNLYLPIFTHAIPSIIGDKYPKYVLENNIIPTYDRIISFKEVRDIYFKLLYLGESAPQGQLFALKAITGFASGIALSDSRNSLTIPDIETAKTISCRKYPECGRMLGERLLKFSEQYKKTVRKKYFGK